MKFVKVDALSFSAARHLFSEDGKDKAPLPGPLHANNVPFTALPSHPMKSVKVDALSTFLYLLPCLPESTSLIIPTLPSKSRQFFPSCFPRYPG